MGHARQQGEGANGRMVIQGSSVRTKNGLTGSVESFFGGSHQCATVRGESGHRYTVVTKDIVDVTWEPRPIRERAYRDDE